MYIDSSPAISFDATVGLLTRYVRLYIESGELGDRFAALDKEEVAYGSGFDVTTVLAQAAQSGGTKAAEHGSYPPNTFNLRFVTKVGGQYAVTMDPKRVRACVGDEAKVQEYAAELTESLYQGWYNTKNAAVANAASSIIEQSAKSGTSVTLGTNVQQYAIDMLTQIKAAVEDMREGITGTAYGNTTVGSDRIAARDVVVIMSNATAALLDANGYSRAFSPEYLDARNVTRITSNRIEEGTVLVTDARNIQVRRNFDELVGPVQNSDASYNYFYNKYDFVEAAVSTSGDTTGQVAFPFYVISTSEPDPGPTAA